jgi:hypothetical protein
LAGSRPCQLCDEGRPFHLHCIACRQPLKPPAKVVCKDCRPEYEREKRKGSKVRIRVKFEEDGPWHRIWVPRSSLATLNSLDRPLSPPGQGPVQGKDGQGTGKSVEVAQETL